MAIVKRRVKKGIRYTVRVRDGIGRWFPSPSFERRVDALGHENLLLSQRDQGGLAPRRAIKDITFGLFAETWKTERRSKISEGWKVSQDQMLRDYVLPVFVSMN